MASQVDIRHGRNGDDLGGAVGGDADIHKLTEVRCDDDAIKPYFIAAGKALKYGNLRRQLSDSLENKPFPSLPEELQKNTYFEFGSIEDHLKYRDPVMKAYPYGNYPVFEGYNHMQYQIRDPEGFAEMICAIIRGERMPEMVMPRK